MKKFRLLYLLLALALLFASACDKIDETSSESKIASSDPSSPESSSVSENPPIDISDSSDESFEYRSEDPDVSEDDHSSSSPSEDVSESSSASSEKTVLTFVSLNDTHGYIEQDEDGECGLSNTAYGISTYSSFFGDDDPETNTWDDVVLFANGDMFQGTAVSNMSKGEAVVMAMNEMHFDGMGIGNHEFDWGIDTVLAYWDGDTSNGEANFPLVNSNIIKKSKKNLLSDVSSSDNLFNSLLIEKMGVKIGLVSVIGPCENSILQSEVADYDFDEVVYSVRETALALREKGAEIVSVNIHFGNASGIDRYDANRKIAELQNDDGSYLVDLIFNGHTHTSQRGLISRPGASPVPVVQAGGYNDALCYIKVEYENKKVVVSEYGFRMISSFGKDYDKKVEAVIDEYVEKIGEHLPTLAVSAVSVYSKNYYSNYLSKIMLKAFNASYSCFNTGCLRGPGGIDVGTKITEAHLYEVIPFDDAVYFVKIKGSALYDFYKDEGDYYVFGQGAAPDISRLKGSNNYYTLAIIDYVYTSTYFAPYKKDVIEEHETGILLRDLLIEDVKIHGKKGVKWDTSKGAMIGQIYYP